MKPCIHSCRVKTHIVAAFICHAITSMIMSVGSTCSSLQNFSIPSIWILSSSSLNWSNSAAIFSWSTCGTSERPPLAKYESTAGSRFQSNRLSRSVATRSEAPVKVENCLTFSFCMRRAAEDMAAVGDLARASRVAEVRGRSWRTVHAW